MSKKENDYEKRASSKPVESGKISKEDIRQKLKGLNITPPPKRRKKK